MANRRKNDYLDYEEMKWMLDQTIFCCCPECGSECIVDSIDHGKDLSGRSVQFTCGKCGSFTADRDIKKGEWKIRGSDLLYLPCTEGNDFTLYQRFDESSYPSRREALEAKYGLIEGLIQPILDLKMDEYFEKFDKETVVCCRELSDMGIAKYKGILARFLLTRNADGLNPETPLDGELLEEIESLVRETDFEGMSEALISLISYDSCGLESGINASRWADLLVDKCLAESKAVNESDRVLLYLRACMVLNALGDVTRSHRLANMAVDLIKKNRSVIEYADELLSDAYSYTDPSLNSFEMSQEIFEHLRGYFEDYPEHYACALFEICLQSDSHPEVRKQALDDLNGFISEFNEDLMDDFYLARAYYVRYKLTGKSADMHKAFNIVTDADEVESETVGIAIITEYLRMVRNDSRRRSKALGKIGMSDMTVDEAIDFLNGCIMERRHPVF